MAVAEKPTPEPKASKEPSQPLGLVFTSIIGTLFVLAGAALVLRGVPMVWDSGVGPAITRATNSFVSTALLITIQVGVAVLLFLGGSKLDKSHTTTGTRGGIFFMIAVAFVAFFALKGLYIAAGRGFSFANIVVMLFYVIIVFLLVQFFRTGRFTNWSLAMDQGGWFDTHAHKRTQGLRVRRLTVLGLMAVAGTGIWTMMEHNYLPANATVKMPDGTERSNRLGDWVVGGTLLEPDAKKLSPEENRARPSRRRCNAITGPAVHDSPHPDCRDDLVRMAGRELSDLWRFPDRDGSRDQQGFVGVAEGAHSRYDCGADRAVSNDAVPVHRRHVLELVVEQRLGTDFANRRRFGTSIAEAK
jgi:hypothetical protein